MRKMLGFLGAIGLAATSVSSVVSCGPDSKSGNGDSDLREFSSIVSKTSLGTLKDSDDNTIINGLIFENAKLHVGFTTDSFSVKNKTVSSATISCDGFAGTVNVNFKVATIDTKEVLESGQFTADYFDKSDRLTEYVGKLYNDIGDKWEIRKEKAVNIFIEMYNYYFNNVAVAVDFKEIITELGKSALKSYFKDYAAKSYVNNKLETISNFMSNYQPDKNDANDWNNQFKSQLTQTFPEFSAQTASPFTFTLSTDVDIELTDYHGFKLSDFFTTEGNSGQFTLQINYNK